MTVYPFLRSIIWIASTTLVSYGCIAIATMRGDAKKQPLRDVLHDILVVPCPLWLPDLLLVLCCFISLFEIMLPTEILLRRTCMCYLLRALTVLVTTMPACAPPFDPAIQVQWPLSSVLWASRYDLMFSGHTIAFLFFAEMWDSHDAPWTRTHIAQNLARYLFPWTLVWARQHYTVDIIVAYVVFHYMLTTRVFAWEMNKETL